PAHRCDGGTGGSGNVSDRVTAAFSTQFRRDTLYLELIILAKGQPGWDHGTGGKAPSIPFVVPLTPGDRPPQLAGGTADTLALLYDGANDIAWIGGRRIPLHGANVVLFDRADGVGGPPEVRPIIRIDPIISVADSTCEGFPQAKVLGLLLRHPEIRSFLER